MGECGRRGLWRETAQGGDPAESRNALRDHRFQTVRCGFGVCREHASDGRPDGAGREAELGECNLGHCCPSDDMWRTGVALAKYIGREAAENNGVELPLTGCEGSLLREV